MPGYADLKPFLQIRKDRVLAALQYLIQCNHLYWDLTINYSMMDGWSDEFIPPEIYNNIICLGTSDYHEREGYTVSLRTGNYKNDLYTAQDTIFNTDDPEPLISSSVYKDVNRERQDPNARIIDALREVVSCNRCSTYKGALAAEDVIDSLDSRQGTMLTISYTIHRQSALINNWEDPCYFTATFPTLFLTGTGGYQDKRAVPVSLTAFTE